MNLANDIGIFSPKLFGVHRNSLLLCTHSYIYNNSLSALSWWRHQVETFFALLALCARNSPVTGEFPAQRPVTRGFDVFFDLCLKKRLSIQSWGSSFETLSRPLWRHSNVYILTACGARVFQLNEKVHKSHGVNFCGHPLPRGWTPVLISPDTAGQVIIRYIDEGDSYGRILIFMTEVDRYIWFWEESKSNKQTSLWSKIAKHNTSASKSRSILSIRGCIMSKFCLRSKVFETFRSRNSIEYKTLYFANIH